MRYLIFLSIFLIFRLIIFYIFPLTFKDTDVIHFTATLFEDPVIRGDNQEFSLRFGNIWQGTKVTIVAPSDEIYSYGQTIEVIGTVKSKLLKNKQTIMTIQNAQIKAKNNGFLPLFGAVRQKIIDFCENNFSQPHAGLLVGIIFGMKNLLTDQITRSFRITGLSHVVAASGMNVTLVAGFLFTLFASFLRRQEATVLSILGIFGYVCLSGFDPSIVRAALMGIVAFTAGLFGRQYSALYVLLLVSGSMLFWDPLLLTNVGFQLSILATLGILVLKPILFGSQIFFDDLGTTISAQIATLPIILSVFGQYSLFSIIANIAVLWTIPLIMIVGGVGIVIGLVFQPLGVVIVSLIIPLLWYLEEVTKFFSSHSTSFLVQSFPLFLFSGYYLILFAYVFFIQRIKVEKSKNTIDTP